MVKAGFNQCLIEIDGLYEHGLGILGANGKELDFGGAEGNLNRRKRFGTLRALPCGVTDAHVQSVGRTGVRTTQLDPEEARVGETVYVSWGAVREECYFDENTLAVQMADLRFAVNGDTMEGLAGTVVVVPVFWREIEAGGVTLRAERSLEGAVVAYKSALMTLPFVAPVPNVGRVVAIPRSSVKGMRSEVKVGDVVTLDKHEYQHQIPLAARHARALKKPLDLWAVPYETVRATRLWNVGAILDPAPFIVGPSSK